MMGPGYVCSLRHQICVLKLVDAKCEWLHQNKKSKPENQNTKSKCMMIQNEFESLMLIMKHQSSTMDLIRRLQENSG